MKFKIFRPLVGAFFFSSKLEPEVVKHFNQRNEKRKLNKKKGL